MKSESEHANTVVVVIGRNEGERLTACLRSLGSNRRRAVYVDSGSTDGSPEAAADAGVQVVHLDLSIPFTAARARNAGFREAERLWGRLSFVQFVDGDCLLDPEWIGAARAFLLERPDVAVVFGRRHERFPQQSVFNRLCDSEWDGPAGESLECGGDILIRAAAFRAAGLYREDLIAGEEPELCVRLRERNWLVVRLALPMTAHDAAITSVRQWWLRCVRAGHAFVEVALLHRHSPFGIWKRSVMRTLFWGGALPLAALGGALMHPASLLLLLLYPLQVWRLARRDGYAAPGSLERALFGMLGKFAELQGMLRFLLGRLAGRQRRLIEYKTA